VALAVHLFLATGQEYRRPQTDPQIAKYGYNQQSSPRMRQPQASSISAVMKKRIFCCWDEACYENSR
ncbi:MAG: hypothetical protein ACN6NT_11770, partial [Comamonas sp.]